MSLEVPCPTENRGERTGVILVVSRLVSSVSDKIWTETLLFSTSVFRCV